MTIAIPLTSSGYRTTPKGIPVMSESPRQDLLEGAQVIEFETQGYLTARSFTKMIDQGLVPNVADAGELKGFYPINVVLDGAAVPTEAQTINDGFTVGCIACYGDRAAIAWVKGMIRLKVGGYVIRRSDVSDTSLVQFSDVPALDVTLEGAVVTLLFGPKLNQDLTRSWRDELAELLFPGSTRVTG